MKINPSISIKKSEIALVLVKGMKKKYKDNDIEITLKNGEKIRTICTFETLKSLLKI